MRADTSEWFSLNQPFHIQEECTSGHCTPLNYTLKLTTINGLATESKIGTNILMFTGNVNKTNDLFRDLLVKPNCDARAAKVTYVVDLKAASSEDYVS